MNHLRNFAFVALVLLLNLQITTLYAAWLRYEPQKITQPDGTVIECFATGDEFYNWLHDENGFTIIKNHQTGYWEFAGLFNENLILTGLIVGRDNPATYGLEPWINIPPEKMQEIRADFLANQMPDPDPIAGFENPRGGGNVGTYNNLVFYIRFSDQQEFTSDTTYYFNLFNNANQGYNSMYNYFKEVSYDMLSMPSHFFPRPPQNTVFSYQDIYPRAYFMPYDANTNPQGYQGDNDRRSREHKLLKRAVEAIAGEVPANLNIDYNNDGYVDNVIFVVRGGTTAWATLLWPHRWVLYSEFAYINGKRVYDYNFNLETSVQNSGVGVLAHEMFHSLGGPDLYHYTSQPVTPVGPWDLMAQNLNPPQSVGAYMKFRYGKWISTIPEITECGTYTLNPITSSQNNCFKIASPNSSSDFFVLEYRRKKGTFEGSAPSSGLLIYRVNSDMDGQGNAQGPPDELYVYRPDGTNYINGTIQQAAFAQDFGRTTFNDNTNPACFLSNDLPGGIDISNVGQIGETISFEVNFKKAPIADFAASANLVTPNCGVNFFDHSLCYVDSWEWTFEGGSPSTSNEQNPAGIYYQNPGLYSVILKVTNQWGENIKVLENYIEVSASHLPEANFTANDTVICINEVIQLTDLSTMCPVAWQWIITPGSHQFVNGTDANSQNPEVIFTSSTNYSIKLLVTNSNGTSELIRSNYIKSGGIPFLDFHGSFEYDLLAQTGWKVENPDNSITWTLWDVDGSGDGTRAAGINLYNYYSFNQRDRLISPPLHTGPVIDAKLKFKHAYARINPNFTDSLIVKISDDCGETWTRLLTLADNGTNNFVTRPPVGANFIPSTPEDWCGTDNGAGCYEIDITQWAGLQNVKIMFESVCIIGNNLFIDDVHFDIILGTEESKPVAGNEKVSIYPNPASEEVTITINNWSARSLQLFDSFGRQVIFDEINVSTENSTLNLNLKGLSGGVYFLRIQGDTISTTKKLIIK